MKASIINWHPDNRCGLVRIFENDIGNYSQYIIDTASNKLLHIELNSKKIMFSISSKLICRKFICDLSYLTDKTVKWIKPGLYLVYKIWKGNEDMLRFDRIYDDEYILMSNIDSSSMISKQLNPLLSQCPTCNDDFLYKVGEYIYPWYTFKKHVDVAYCPSCGTGYRYNLFDESMDIQAII